eukprot:395583-Prorocentrum_minimum.AAC.1
MPSSLGCPSGASRQPGGGDQVLSERLAVHAASPRGCFAPSRSCSVSARPAQTGGERIHERASAQPWELKDSSTPRSAPCYCAAAISLRNDDEHLLQVVM